MAVIVANGALTLTSCILGLQHLYVHIFNQMGKGCSKINLQFQKSKLAIFFVGII